MEGVGAAGDSVDAHDVDLGALRGGGSVGVGGGGAVRGDVCRTDSPAAHNKKWKMCHVITANQSSR